MLIDTHAHVNFQDYKEDFEAVFERARQRSVAIINVGSQFSTSKRAVESAQNRDRVYAAVGLHPIQLEDYQVTEEGRSFTARAETFDYASYYELARQDKVVGIGECGLDYFYIDESKDINKIKEKQRVTLHEQIKLANDCEKPLILHVRGSRNNPLDAYEDLLHELKLDLPTKRGVIHCFTEGYDLAKQFLELGFYLGFTGLITFDKTGKTQDTLSQMPIDKILTETDCPYLTPEPFRGRRNEPIYVEYVVAKIAQLRNIPFDELAAQTVSNAKRLFNLVF